MTISASFGAEGTRVGSAVARRLGLPFVDRAIPLQVADRLGLPPGDALARDEQVQGAMISSLVNLIGAPVSFGVSGVQTQHADSQEEFRRATEKVLWDLASDGGGVVLGRAGAVVLASCPGALHVRLDGPADARAARAAAARDIDVDAARDQLRRTDQARTAYLRQLYGDDPDDPELYHLVIDTTAVSPEASAEAIAALARARPEPAHYGTLIAAVGLDPAFLGDASAAGTLDALTPVWMALVQARGGNRRVALRVVEG